MKIVFSILVLLTASTSLANVFEGTWFNRERTAAVEMTAFEGKVTFHTRSFYNNGAPSDYFFEFTVPADFAQNPQQILKGRLRSVDGYYGCLFDEELQVQMDHSRRVRLHYPLLTFSRVQRSVNDGRGGSIYQREVEWTSWGWVETIRHFPVERWRVVSDECVIKARNWTTGILVK